MKGTGVLQLVRLFPLEFEALFTDQTQEDVSSSSVLELLRFPGHMDEKEQQTADWLVQFVNSCNPEGMLMPRVCLDHF